MSTEYTDIGLPAYQNGQFRRILYVLVADMYNRNQYNLAVVYTLWNILQIVIGADDEYFWTLGSSLRLWSPRVRVDEHKVMLTQFIVRHDGMY